MCLREMGELEDRTPYCSRVRRAGLPQGEDDGFAVLQVAVDLGRQGVHVVLPQELDPLLSLAVFGWGDGHRTHITRLDPPHIVIQDPSQCDPGWGDNGKSSRLRSHPNVHSCLHQKILSLMRLNKKTIRLQTLQSVVHWLSPPLHPLHLFHVMLGLIVSHILIFCQLISVDNRDECLRCMGECF